MTSRLRAVAGGAAALLVALAAPASALAPDAGTVAPSSTLPSTAPSTTPATPSGSPPAPGSTPAPTSTTNDGDGDGDGDGTPDVGPDEVDTPGAVVLTDVAPAAMRAGETVRLRGRITNTGTDVLQAVVVLPRFSRVALDNPAEIVRIGTDPEFRRGIRTDSSFTELPSDLAPGDGADFTIDVDVDALGLPGEGVYALGVDVRANVGAQARSTAASARTAVPLLRPAEQVTPVPVAMVWPLAHRPTVLADGTFLDDDLAGDLAPGGPLDTRLRAPGEAPVTWLLDPDLVDTVDRMRDGYQVRDGDDVVDGAGTAAAEAWRQQLDSALTGDDVLILPTAAPDAVALGADTALREEVVGAAARRSLAAREDVDVLSGARLAWAADPTDTVSSIGTWTTAGVQTVLLPADATVTEAEIDAGSVRADARLGQVVTSAAPLEDPAAAAFDVTQQWRAETAFQLLEGPTDREPVVVAIPPTWDAESAVVDAVMDAWTTTPWTEAVPVDATVTARSEALPAPVDAAPDLPSAAVGPLPQENVLAAAELSVATERYRSLLGDAAELPQLDPALARMLSTSWREDPARAREATELMVDQASEPFDAVSVEVSAGITLAGDAGVFPITVVNDLDVPVTVDLDVRANNPARLVVEDLDPQTINPAESTTISVAAQATANGRVPVTVQLTTADGQPIGPLQRTIITATAYGTFGWVAIGLGGFVFVGLLGQRIVRQRRAPRHTGASTPDPGPVGEP